MDIFQIRDLLEEWFSPRKGRLPMSADEDYAEAEMALHALRSLFESELRRRDEGVPPQGQDRLD